MDKEEFQAWKDSAATRWVLAQIQAKATAIGLQCRENLYGSTGNSPEEWAALQSRAGYDRGYVTAIEELVQLEHEDVAEPKRD